MGNTFTTFIYSLFLTRSHRHVSDESFHFCLFICFVCFLLSTVQSVQRPAAAVRGSAPPGSPRCLALQRLQQEQQESLQREKEEAQQKERERQAEEREKEEQREEVSCWLNTQHCSDLAQLYSGLYCCSQVQRLQGRCEQQERQLTVLRQELRKTTLGLEAFIITTQHYCLQVAAIFLN